MKNIVLYFVFAAVSATFFASCDDLLDVTPQSEMTDANFWKSETDFKGACNQMYYQLSYGSHDSRSDEYVMKSFDVISDGSRSTPATSADDWTDPYKRIFIANNIIEKGKASSLSESVVNRWIAEAYFFRAYEHFNLVCKYGDVPLITKVFTSVYDADLKMGRTPRETVIQQCYDDLKFAATYLPTRAAWTTTDEFDRRRVTRSSALGLIVRIGLFEGTMQKYHNLGANWKNHLKEAIDAYDLLKAEGHELYKATYTTGIPPFLGQFIEESPANNKEIIFAKAYGPNGGSGSGYTNHSFSGDSEGTYALSRNVIDLFLYDDGLPREKTNPANVVSPETSFNDIILHRDPRLAMTIWTISDPLETHSLIGWLHPNVGKNAFMPFNSQRPQGYQMKKMFIGERWGASKDYTDRIIIRWGEILLAYAEALYEYNGNITDAQLDETVNALRERAGWNVKLTNSLVSANGLDMLTEIRRERSVELMGENVRYTDLIRWKTAETLLPKALIGAKCVETADAKDGFLPNCTDATGKLDGEQIVPYPEDGIFVVQKSSVRKFDPEKDYFYPIPVFEIAQSEGAIKQNKGWLEGN
ncbi:MAG: RagB/SusD family nutrient uptake outer membrane protein [Candidatus Symbiothrix sp.]|jgi:hypothetical protein|nr:RagB/SusD family nutrient uptake outer membrane protein [Candidatus Symbiothrix sp.]